MQDGRETRHGPIDARLTAAVAAVIVLVAALTAVALRSADRPPVAIIGDSITYNAEAATDKALGDDWLLTIDGRPGFRIEQQLPVAQRAAALPFDQVVINLGTNDVLTATQDLNASIAALDAMVAGFDDGPRCIHLVTVSESIVNENVDAPARARTINDEIDRLAAANPRVDVIDWAGIVTDWEAAHPGETLTVDTVHPDTRGNQVLVAAYDEALAGCPS